MSDNNSQVGPNQIAHRQVTIIGSGPAGLTAAIYTARANLFPLVLHGPLAGGQLTTTTDVENFPGFPEGIKGPELMEKMMLQTTRFGGELKTVYVTKVEGLKPPFKVTFDDNSSITTDTLIVSTGAKPRMLGLPNESELLGWGLSTCATCDGAFFKNKEIVVVGGGDSACEEAGYLTRFGSKVYLIHRRDSLRASKIMAERVLKNPKIQPIWNSEVVELTGSQDSGLNGIKIRNLLTKDITDFPCSAVFYAIGHTPNTELFKDMLNLDENGYIKTVPGMTTTNIPGLFACGDCQDHVWRQAVTAAGSGCMAAMEAERFISEHY